MTLFDRVFGGNDYNYERTVAAIDAAIATYGEAEPVAFPNTAYNLPCYYSITGKKIENLGELKAALLNDVKPMMTRNPRLQDAFDSGIASALCAEFLEVLKYTPGIQLNIYSPKFIQAPPDDVPGMLIRSAPLILTPAQAGSHFHP